jgi:hypothetical protein
MSKDVDEIEEEADEDEEDEEGTRIEEKAAAFSIKALCYKTVDVFAGITSRKLWLKDAGNGSACTDGHLINVPFRHPRAYQFTEHELSHILFQSDGFAREKFVQDYAQKVVSVVPATQPGERTLRRAMSNITGILDDERVISLWGQLYRGSEVIMRQMKREESKPVLPEAHDGILLALYCLSGGHDIPPGRLDRYKPYMVEALRKVRGRDFLSTLITSKWLINMLVGEMIRESRNEDPPVGAATNLFAIGAVGGVAGNSPGNAPEPPQDSKARKVAAKAEEAPEVVQSPSEGGADPSPWKPPEVEATFDTRVVALQKLLGSFGVLSKEAQQDVDDVQPSKFRKVQDQAFAVKLVNMAMGADVKDADVMERALAASAAHMQTILDRARAATRNVPHEDDRIRQDSYAKVVFRDEAPSSLANLSMDILPEDQHTIQRLRAAFIRVMGRRSNRLDEAGVALDVPTLLARKLTGEPLPVFQTECFNRGFKSLILIDRSSSMSGSRTEQAERSCRIISRAMRFPFVHGAVWGFQSWHDGQVDITRFAPGLETFTSESCQVGGTTPLHTAIRVAVRHLESGYERKHLFVVSDGFPVYTRKDGQQFGTNTLMGFVREEVRRARSHGIGITGVMIGRDVTDKGMGFMFGSTRNWRIMDKDFGEDLIRLVAGSFVNHLRGE